MSRAQRLGMLAGVLLALLLLALFAALVLATAGAGYRALVLVWLWALPFLGVLGGAGWLAGGAAERLRAAK